MNKKDEKIIMVTGFVIAFLLRALSAKDQLITFDGFGYIYHSLAIADGKIQFPYWAKTGSPYYPPGYPLFIYLSHLLFRSWESASKIVNVLFGSLLLVPIYSGTKKMFGSKAGLYSALLLVSHPLLVELGSNAYSEPSFLFFCSISFVLGFSYLKTKKYSASFFSGLLLGLAYLIRGLSIICILSLLISFFLVWLFEKEKKLNTLLLPIILLCFGFYIFALPYDLYCFKKDKIYSLRAKQEFFKKGKGYMDGPDWSIKEATLSKDGKELENFYLARTKGPIKFIISEPEEYLEWLKRDFCFTMRNFFSSDSVMPALLLLSSFFFLLLEALERKKNKKEAWTFLYLSLWLFCPFIFIVLFITPIPRYFSICLIPIVIISGRGLENLENLLARLLKLKSSRIISVMVILSVLLLYPHKKVFHFIKDKSDFKVLHNQTVEISKWLKANIGENKIILCNKPAYAYYSNNYWYLAPRANPEELAKYAIAQGAHYVLLSRIHLKWLLVPDYEVERYFEPLSKPALEYLGSPPQSVLNNKNFVLYKVIKQ